MKRPTTARTFVVSSYSEDIFDSFSSAKKPDYSVSAKSRIQTPSYTQETIKAYNSRKYLINEKDYHEESIVKNRPRVPHDYSDHNQHSQYCWSFKSSMVTAAIAYHPRQKGLYGKSNRISHLRSIFENNPETVNPVYPPCGKGRSQSLTVRSKDAESSIFNSEKNAIESTKKESTCPPKKNESNIVFQSTCGTNFYEILNIKRSCNYEKINGKLEAAYRAESKLIVPTRYSSNKEWLRRTHILIQPVQNSAAYLDEKERLKRNIFADTQNLIK